MSRRLFDALGELREPIGRAAHLLVGLDFDGTLSPIVARPELVALPAETRDALEAISARPDCTLAILSGRRLADVKDRGAEKTKRKRPQSNPPPPPPRPVNPN